VLLLGGESTLAHQHNSYLNENELYVKLKKKKKKKKKKNKHASSSSSSMMMMMFVVAQAILNLLFHLIFSRGFLLTKFVLQNKTTMQTNDWREKKNILFESLQQAKKTKDDYDDHVNDKKSDLVSKLIVLIIDGARYDWAHYNRNEDDDDVNDGYVLPSLSLSQSSTTTSTTTSNKLLFKFIADAPTTTSQRLKALLTGSYPTFIDISNSFSSKTIEEDNLIYQLKHNGKKRIMFSGDDTWGDLFPLETNDDDNDDNDKDKNNFFSSFEAFPSMNVKDTETVDNGVRNSWKKTHELAVRAFSSRSNNKTKQNNDNADDWDVWIGHMLGADHVGHTYGAKTNEMKEKLAQNDKDIKNIMDDLKREKDVYENALFLVFGDHGMTDEGDHGGSSPVEVNSFLFAYRPHGGRRRLRRRNNSITNEDLFTRAHSLYGGGVDGNDSDDGPFEMIQIDLVPTLSSLMGVPIPFSSLGIVNEKLLELFFDVDDNDANADDNSFSWSVFFQSALDANVHQVWTYLKEYENTRASAKPKNSIDSGGDSFHSSETPSFAFNKQLEEMYAKYENVSWNETAYDDANMNEENKIELGYAFLRETQKVTRNSWVTFGIYSMIFGLLGLVGLHCAYAYVIICCFKYNNNNNNNGDENFQGRKREDSVTRFPSPFCFESIPYLFIVSLIVFILSLAARCSNSFIENEREVYQYLLATLLATTCVDGLRSTKATTTTANATNFIEDDGKNKQVQEMRRRNIRSDNDNAVIEQNSSQKSDKVIFNAIIAMICNALLAHIGETWVKIDDNKVVASRDETVLIFATFCFALINHLQNFEMVISWLFWTLAALYRNNLWYPRIVFASSFILFPLTRTFETFSPRRRMNSKDFLWTSLPFFAILTNSRHIGGVFILLGAHLMNFSALAIAQMLKSFKNMTTTITATTTQKKNEKKKKIIITALIINKNKNKEALEMFGSIFAICVASIFFSQVIFYGGGHWVKFNGIRFTAGMTGIDSFNWYICGLLLGLDTFCGEIISVLMFPIFLSLFSSSTSLLSEKSIRTVGFLMLGFMRSFGVFISTAFVAYERRHLMTWAIFAPKFIFEICALLSFESVILFSFLLASHSLVIENLDEDEEKSNM